MGLRRRNQGALKVTPEVYGDRVLTYVLPHFQKAIAHEAAYAAEKAVRPVVELLREWQARPFTSNEILQMKLELQETTARLEQLICKAGEHDGTN